MAAAPRVVIIGAGIVGTNLADELVSRGWTDITVVEQGPLDTPGGSTSHAPGLVFQVNPSRTMSLFARYTVEKLLALRDDDGSSCFDQVGGLEVATTPERLQELKRRHGLATSWGIDTRLVDAAACRALWPGLCAARVLGGLHIPSDGLARAARAVQLLVARTRAAGVRYLARTAVTGIERAAGRVTSVATARGSLAADVVVSCAGFWGADVGALAGVAVPLVPMAHHYATTGPVPGGGAALPILRHQDRDLYVRTLGDGYGIGSYGHEPEPVAAAALGPTPARVDAANMPSRLPLAARDFAAELEHARALLPALRRAAVTDAFSGVLSFTPDGGPLVGAAPGLDGFYVAEAVWVTHSAGVARALAELLTHGRAGLDLSGCALARFDAAQLTPAYVAATSRQSFVDVYRIQHPHRPRDALRGLRVAPFHARLEALGAVFFDGPGAWERAEWFEANAGLAARLPPAWQPAAPPDAWAARHASPVAAAEAWATRTAAALYDMTWRPRLDVAGPGAAHLLARLATAGATAGTVAHALLLDGGGGVAGDVTVAALPGGVFRLGAGTPLELAHVAAEARLQSREQPELFVEARDVTGATCCVGLWGPRARHVLAAAADAPARAPPARGRVASLCVAGVLVTALGVSHVGEPGWELHSGAEHGLRLWDALWQAGRAHGVVAAGRAAFFSLRLESGLPIWGTDVTAEHDPYAAGLEHALAAGRTGYVGHGALAGRSAATGTRRLRCLTVDDGYSIVVGKEPVYAGGRPVGHVTSAAFGYTLGRPVAFADLPAAVAAGSAVEIEYFGRRVAATVAAAPLYEPAARRPRL